MLLTAQDLTLRRKKRDFYPGHLMLKGIFPHQIQYEEKEFLNCGWFSTLFKINSRKHQKTVNNLVLGTTERRELSLFKAELTEKRQHMKNSLEGTVWQQNAGMADCCMPGNGDCLSRVQKAGHSLLT